MNKVSKTSIKLLVAVLMLGLCSCATYEYHETKTVRTKVLSEVEREAIPEQELLDIGIVVFDTGLDQLNDDEIAYSSVRQSEAVWFSSQLKNTLDKSNAWGLVRSMPAANAVMDLLVKGKILESNGEVLRLQINAIDATGREWLDKEYFQRTSAYSYNPKVQQNFKRDPFASLFSEIANDLLKTSAQLKGADKLAIRNVAKMRFASKFLPEAYAGYLENNKGRYKLIQAPAKNDPMIQRIDSIRARQDLFLDVVQDYYRVFTSNMELPYQEWRSTAYREVIYARQLKSQARVQKLAGVASLVLGILAQGSNDRDNRSAGHVGIYAGAELIYQGYAKQAEAEIHSATLRELGETLEAELEPSVIELEDRSVTLSGTVEDQFTEWQQILGEMFKAENGIIVGDEKFAELKPLVKKPLADKELSASKEPSANQSPSIAIEQ